LRFFIIALFLIFGACAPTSPKLTLPQNCRAGFNAEQLLSRHWLTQPGVWRLRQGVLLEIGSKKMPLEGFLRLDLNRHEARLLALNEMGVVLFDLQVSAESEELKRAIPQLQKIPGLAQGVARSLRQIFLIPRPTLQDRFGNGGNSQRLWRPMVDGQISFLFDCQGDLRETRQQGETDDWRVVYNQYQSFGEVTLPMQIVMNDYRHNVKLSLWIREVKQEP
jgi:hypothetical protein